MRRRLRGAAAAVALWTASAAPAVATPVPLPPKPDFSSMRYLIGTWSCTSKSARRPIPSFGEITYAFDPAGYAIDMSVTHHGTPWYPYEHFGSNRILYDADGGRWITMVTESDGGFAVLDSTGWNGPQLVWRDVTPQAKGDAGHDDDYTITRVSETEYSTATTVRAADGTTIDVRGACRKRS